MALRATRQYGEVLEQGEGALRVTRQYTEVLEQGEGALRVTRQYGEVLVSPTAVYTENLSDTLTITDVVDVSGEFHVIIEDSLTLVDLVTTQIPVNAITSLVITDNAHLNFTGAANDSLSIEEFLAYNLIEDDFIYCPEVLTIAEEVYVETGNWRSVPETLTINQTVSWVGPQYPDPVLTYINISEVVEAVYPKRYSLEDEVEFMEIAGREIPQIITSPVNFVESLTHLHYYASTSLVLNESVSAAKSKGTLITELNPVESVILNAIWIRNLTENTGLGHTLTYYIISSCIDKTYGPFIGESTVNGQPDPPSSTEPFVQGLPEGVKFRLVYPAKGGAEDTVDLRAPQFGNLDRLAMDRVNRETRGGDLVIFADPNWPKRQTVSVTISGLTTNEVTDLQRFIADHLGEEIHITDWEGREWEAVIISPNEPATNDGKDNWSVGFEFEGVLYDGLQSGEGLSVQQVVLYLMDRSLPLVESLTITDSVLFWHYPA